MSIREFNMSDMDAVIDIWVRASVKAHSFMAEEFWKNKAQCMRNKYIPLAETRVFIEDREIKGFISLYGENLAAIFIDPKFQGKGIGRKLIDEVKSIRKKLVLNVYKSNTRTIEFYKKCGFRIVGEGVCEHTGHSELLMEYIG